jgi:hypothetical protein
MPEISPFVAFAALALVLILIGSMWLFGGRRPRRDAGPRLRPVRRFIGLLVLLTGLLSAFLGFTVYRYLQLFDDEPVAVITLKQQGPQQFLATVTLNSHDVIGAPPAVHEFTVNGDAWMMDARVLRWQLPAALAGVPSLYRLERLSGRYDAVEQERTALRTVYELGNAAAPDLWSLKKQFPTWLPFVDAQFGSATWMPMFDNAQYTVLFNGRGGLLAKPADAPTAEGLRKRGW